jgi:hypothetical protein
MNLLYYIYKSIVSPLGVINREKSKYKLAASVLIVSVAAVSNSIITPVLYYLVNRGRFEIHIHVGDMFLNTCIGVLTWLTACTLFWLFSIVFKKGVNFTQITSTWGFSYIPNFLCIIAFSLLQLKIGLYNGNSLAAFFISAFFIMLLVWKAIYYFMQMKLVMGVTAKELLIITALAGVAFFAMMTVGFKLGIQIPML